MNTRLLISIAISGVLHTGVFVAGSGWHRQFLAGLDDVRRTEILTVSVEPRALPSEPADSSSGGSRPVPPAPGQETVRGEIPPERASPQSRSRSRPAASRVFAARADHGHAADPAETQAPDAAATPGTGSSPSPTASRNVPAEEAAARSGEGAGPRSPASTSEQGDDHRDKVERTYLAEFLAELSKHKHYPRSARVRRQQGKVVVALVLRDDGSINDVQVEEPSHYPILNRAALRSVKQLKRFKPFPEDLNRSAWHLSVPFQYSIRDR